MNGFNINTFLQIASLLLSILIIPLVKFIISRELKKLEAADAENKTLIEKFVKDFSDRLKEYETGTRQEIDKIKTEFNQFKCEIPMIYVMRDEFIRAIATFERKIDKMLDWIAKKGE